MNPLGTMQFPRAALISTAILALGLSANAAPKPRFTFTDIGTLPGSSNTVALKINNRGQVIGTTMDASGQHQPFIYSDGVMTFITGVPGTPHDINDSGAIVGSMAVDCEPHAFLFSGGVVTDLNLILGVGWDWGVAHGINASGVIVGWGGQFNILPTPFWLSNGVAGFFPTPFGTDYANPYEINSAGQAAGDLGMITNDAGGGVQHAYIFQYDRAIDLGVLPGDFNSYAYDINNAGWVVGVSESFQGGPTRAFLHANGALHDLNDLLKDEPDWELSGANGVNDHGQIVGYGLRNGELCGFLLTPKKEPKP